MGALLSARERLRLFLEETDLAAKKSLGQNFLVSDEVISRILERVKRFDGPSLIEIGPGPGALTDHLRLMGKPLLVIELDHVMASVWRGRGLPVLEEDALRCDWEALVPAEGACLVSNLPYQISSSLVVDRSVAGPTRLNSMVLMFQKEVAQRLRAKPSSEDYGFLSVIAQVFWEMELVSEAGPRDFQPPPRVASRVLSFRRKASPVARPQVFLGFVKEAFAQRRKLLKSNLKTWMGSRRIEEQKLLAKLEAFGLKETARAEELGPSQFVELYEHLDRS